jgi:hypothetical protein
MVSKELRERTFVHSRHKTKYRYYTVHRAEEDADGNITIDCGAKLKDPVVAYWDAETYYKLVIRLRYASDYIPCYKCQVPEILERHVWGS